MFSKIFKLNFLKIVLVLGIAGLFFILNNYQVIAQSQSSDAIAIRILPNPNHYSISRWYNNYFGSGGAPQLSTVDGYEAIRDGRSVYVNVANVNSSNVLYTNVYLISFNQSAENATIDIFSKILANWKFNTNKPVYGLCREDNTISCLSDNDCPIGDYCTSDKARIVRDTKRLSDISEIKVLLEEYKQENGSYPILQSGTYLSNRSVSVWPSWRGAFSDELEIMLPTDPVNKIGPCPGFNEDTCWDEENLKFSDNLPDLPQNSLVYTYVTDPTGTDLNLCAVFESGLLISGGANVGNCAEICLDFDGDGYGSPDSTDCAFLGNDCNDNDPSVTTGSSEDCSNGSDDDCDGYIDCFDVADCSSDPLCSGAAFCDEDGVCDSGETCAACPLDNCCDCGDGVCDTSKGECTTCYGPGLDCSCGDNIICPSVEGCDDGNSNSGDGCSSACSIETVNCIDNDGDGFYKADPGCSGSNDCDDNPLSCGASCYPGGTEVCDGYDNDCDGAADNGSGITEENCAYVCVALDAAYNFNVSRTGVYTCCGDDGVEGNPYQAVESLCSDGRDNDCDGYVDSADSDCSGFCTDSGENNFTNFSTPGQCNQCNNLDDNDGDQTQFGEDWALYWDMVDNCDSDCGTVATTIQLSEYEDGDEVSCDGIDNDCDGEVDEGLTNVFYQDSDGDGYGDVLNTQEACSAPSGYVTNSDDCDDSLANVNPGTAEICDGIDNNCDGGIDEGLTIEYYRDGDGDSYGDPNNILDGCVGSIPAGYVEDNQDCDDTNSSVNPGSSEVCDNGLDDDCDGVINNGCNVCYEDLDGDTYGNNANSSMMATCSSGWVSDNTDCDDNLDYVNPGETETCDGNDNNCDGNVDEGCDDDGDGYCDSGMALYNSNSMCANTLYTFPADNGLAGDDCNDAVASIYPGADEICGDTIDQDCDGSDLLCTGVCTDDDGDQEIVEATNLALCGQVCGDGSQTCLGNNDCDDTDANNANLKTEICDDGQDNDCDGAVDCDDSDCPPCPNECKFDPDSFPLSCDFNL